MSSAPVHLQVKLGEAASVIVHPASSRLRAQTSIVDDPGDLLSYLPSCGGYAFLKGNDGIIGIGEIARFETDTPDAADVWWQNFISELEDESELPGVYGARPLAFGSFTFNPDNTKITSVFVVPKLVLGRRDGQSWITRIDYDSPKRHGLPKQGPPIHDPGRVRLDGSSVSDAQWIKSAGDIIDRIRHGEAEKVVLAKNQIIKADQSIDQRWLADKLHTAYPMCWTYMFDGFVGATPEMIATQRDHLVLSRVLAGTQPLRRRASDDATTTRQRLADAFTSLRLNPKELREHAFARDSVIEQMQPFCSAINSNPSPFILELPHLLHLATDVVGQVCPGNTSLAVAAGIHPTAAVCGTPRHVAQELIARYEGFDRGRYAGPIGWMDVSGNGEWALGLRCGQINPLDPSKIEIYAGCGLIADSNPVAELAEIKQKYQAMLAVLGLEMEQS